MSQGPGADGGVRRLPPRHEDLRKGKNGAMTINVEEEIRKRAEKVTQKDMEDLLGKKNMAARLSRKAGFLSQYWDDIKTAFSLIRDWLRGAYDKAPGRMIASLAGALIYFISPIDLVPDCIPGLGFLDDAAILAAVFKLSEADLNFYRRWKHKRRPDEEPEVADDAVEVVGV